jgi:co-chaperonin GroES (HSP10)
MSKGLLLPKSVAVATAIAKTARHRMDSDDWATPKDVEEQLKQLQEYIDLRREDDPSYRLPIPTGWKVMMLMLTIPEKSAGGVIVIDDAKEARSLSSPQGVVLAIGDQAYQDPQRFSAPWLRIGDRITVVKYDASMFQLANGQRLGFVNDTQPISVIDSGWEVPK